MHDWNGSETENNRRSAHARGLLQCSLLERVLFDLTSVFSVILSLCRNHTTRLSDAPHAWLGSSKLRLPWR